MVVKDGVVQIAYNIIGGILVSGLALLLQLFYRKLHARRFQQVFQDEDDGEFYVVYKSVESKRDVVFPAEESKVPRGTPATTNLTLINSCAATRSVGYLVYTFGKSIGKPPLIVSHADVDQKMNLSFISIGGPTNHKTKDLMANSANKLLDYEHGKIVAKDSRKILVKDGDEAGFDYGFIIKIHPTNFPQRTWICCGGFGEWGTSGVAWYLSHRWNDIRKLAGKREFACITKTKIGCDEDTYLMGQFQNIKEIDKYARDAEKKNVAITSVKVSPTGTVTTTTIVKGDSKKAYCTELPPEPPSV
ncbi:MAG: hypothetical protein ABSG22_07335 [Sedimentisphaerales bacterium]|jgi:hypothetical protein